MHNLFLACYNGSMSFIRERPNLYYLALKIRVFFNKGEALQKYPVMGVKEYCLKNGLPVEILEEPKERMICEPAYFRFSSEIIHKKYSPEIYMTELCDVDVIGSNSFIIKDGYCLYDFFSFNTEDRFDLRFSSLKITKKKGACLLFVDTDEPPIEEAIFLLGFGSFNLFHLTIEILAKFLYIDSHEIANIPLLVDEIVMKIPQFRQLLEILNLHNRKIFAIKKGSIHRIKKLLYFSECTWMPINLKSRTYFTLDDYRISEHCIEYVKKTVSSHFRLQQKKHRKKKIFISRKNQHHARLVNESEISSLFAQYGFEVIHPELLSFEEQVRLFSEASHIAGTTGAAFTNIIYCSPKTIFTCIIPASHHFYMYSTIAKLLGLRSIFLDADIFEKGTKTSGDKFILDAEYCRDFLQRLEYDNEWSCSTC